MNIGDLANEISELGYEIELLNNSRDKRYIDRIAIFGTSGNY